MHPLREINEVDATTLRLDGVYNWVIMIEGELHKIFPSLSLSPNEACD